MSIFDLAILFIFWSGFGFGFFICKYKSDLLNSLKAIICMGAKILGRR